MKQLRFCFLTSLCFAISSLTAADLVKEAGDWIVKHLFNKDI